MAIQLGQNRMNPPDLFLKSPPSSTSLGGSCWPDPAVCQCPLCCVDECPAATERRRCCGGSLLNRGLKTVSNFVTWWRWGWRWWCGEPGSVMMLLGVGAHHCTTTAVCRPTCPRLQHLTALHCLDQELSIQGDLACSQDLQLSFRFPASHQLYVLCV